MRPSGCVYQLGKFFLGLAKLLLEMTKQLLFLALGVIHVVIGEFGKLLPELSFELMPFTFLIRQQAP